MSDARIGDALFEDLGALVDHRVQAALEDSSSVIVARLMPRSAANSRIIFSVTGEAWRCAARRSRSSRRRSSGRGGPSRTAPRGRSRSSTFLVPADVQAGQVAHRERAHREAEVVEHAVDVPGHAPSRSSFWPACWRAQHAVADEAVADARPARRPCRSSWRSASRGEHGSGGLVAAHDFQQLHDVGRREEVHADHASGTLGRRGDLVDVQRRGVGGEDRARLGDGVELGEHSFLMSMFSNTASMTRSQSARRSVERAGEQRHALLDVVGGGGRAWRCSRSSCG
jgi:hypothetical protein